MNIKITALAVFAVTIGVIAFYPDLQASGSKGETVNGNVLVSDRPVIDVVFVLDTTGSMSGLIQTAKEKIWSIASTMASAQQTPDIRIGLVGYRDRGDAYVTKVVDLNSDLDAVYANLMDFQAGGGGDTPESVNKALYDAVHSMSWSAVDQSYQAIFLVGDAPPHMDYNEMQYPAIIAAAAERGIVVNTIQAGNMTATVAPWTTMAGLGQGTYFQVEQGGGAVAFESPFDKEIAALSAKLDQTRLYYGDAQERARMEEKLEHSAKVHSEASIFAQARRGAFNSTAAGRNNLLGEKELVDAVSKGAVDLDDIDANALPAALKVMAPEEQEAYVAKLADERADLQRQIRSLAGERDAFIAKKVEEAGGMDDSLDVMLYEAVKEQAEESGFTYEGGPAY